MEPRRTLGGGQGLSDEPGRVGRVVLLDGDGFQPMREETGPFIRTEVTAEILDRNDRARAQRQADLAAGLDASGMATFTTSNGSGSYDPRDESDVARARKCIAAADGPEAAAAWIPWTPPIPEPDESDDVVRCDVCGAPPFVNRARLQRHYESRHPDTEPPPEPLPPEPVLDVPPEPTGDELRQIYAEDPLGKPAVLPPWLRD